MVELRGRTVILRALEREHCRELWEAYEPTAPLPTERIRPGLSVEGAENWFEDIQVGQGKSRIDLGIFTLDGRLVGDIQLAQIDWQNRTAELGVGIARAADRGQGYGTDAARTIIDYAFDALDLVRIAAATAEYNHLAQAGLRHAGFVEEGREREATYLNGRRWDRLCYGLLRREYTGS
ncbi:GNAT family N-acetyltransferase [Promineifilum sp.]|uniref:GNAT family N-acetyltransferase n=1 Tax=Promineifilum sp. TaxID=2664178 RepID=UPI0035B307E7